MAQAISMSIQVFYNVTVQVCSLRTVASIGGRKRAVRWPNQRWALLHLLCATPAQVRPTWQVSPMLQNIKPLIAVLLVVGICFWGYRRWVFTDVLPRATLDRLMHGWMLISAALFLAPDFWIFLIAAGGTLWWLGQHVHPAVLFAGLLYAAPVYEKYLPGFAGINALFGLYYQRVLALAVLFLWLYRWAPKKAAPGFRATLFDHLVLAMGLYRLMLQLPVDSVTNSIRELVHYAIDVILVFWVGRRLCSDPAINREAISAFALGIMTVCALAAFEFIKRWLLYPAVATSLGVPAGGGGYLMRGDTGLLRTFATTGQPIPLGYVALVGIMLWLAIGESFKLPMRIRVMGLLLLAAGSIASLARGPWVALVGTLLLWLSMSPQGLKRLMMGSVVLAGIGVLAVFSPMGDDILSLLPGGSQTEDYNVMYRKRLIQVSMILIGQNPWTGTPDFMTAPIMQQLIQGEGIIDLVNTYIGLALGTGLIGAGLFTALIIGPMLLGVSTYLQLRQLDRTSALHKDMKALAPMFCALLALCLGTAVTIGTVSSITVIPWTYWLLAGMTVGMTQTIKRTLATMPRSRQPK
jgi:hypothetical protein